MFKKIGIPLNKAASAGLGLAMAAPLVLLAAAPQASAAVVTNKEIQAQVQHGISGPVCLFFTINHPNGGVGQSYKALGNYTNDWYKHPITVNPGDKVTVDQYNHVDSDDGCTGSKVATGSQTVPSDDKTYVWVNTNKL